MTIRVVDMGENPIPEEAQHAAAVVIETTDVNNIPVVCETIPFFSSVSFGVWIFAGARDEPDEKSGLFHFLEHLVFKGTARRRSADIAVEIDALGGNIDAFTSREVTCYSGRVVTERLDSAFDLVADITLNSTFPESEMELERRVVLEEIRSVEDSPSEFVHDRLYTARWHGSPLGTMITGTPQTVESFTRDDLTGLRNRFYRPPRIVITACGAIEPARLRGLVAKHFSGLAGAPPAKEEFTEPENKNGLVTIHKPLEQTHLVMGTKGLPVCHPRRHELSILNLILGGGVSSRLFQSVRERQGLAYSVYSFFDQYQQTGLLGVYSACHPCVLGQVWERIIGELRKISNQPPSAEEIQRAKDQSMDNIKMSFESPGARMSQLAYQTLYFGKVFTMQEALEDVQQVTAEGVMSLANTLLKEDDYTVVTLGPESDDDTWFTGTSNIVSS